MYVKSTNLEEYLGVKVFRFGLAEEKDQVGQVTGLAWTQVGGELLTIEATTVPGKGGLIKRFLRGCNVRVNFRCINCCS